MSREHGHEHEHELRACGRTVKTAGAASGDTRLVLLVGHDITSHFWLNILPFAVDPRLRTYMTQDDLESVVHRIHVIPEVVPAFLVVHGGFFVDWFPAPLPEPNAPPQPQVLLGKAEQLLKGYCVKPSLSEHNRHII